MKTTCRTTHIYKPHSRAERALVLAVLTALLSGAAATPAMARDRTIEKNETVKVTDATGATGEINHRACLTYSATEKESDTNNITNSTSGNTLTLLGTVDASEGKYMAWITPAYSGGADVLSKNHVFIQGGTTYYGIVYGCWSKSGAVKENRVDMSVGNVNFAYGGWSVNGDATDNTVALTGGKISGDAYGGHSNNGAVTGNKVAISGGTALWVCGGHSENGAVTKNTVAITGGTVGIAQGGYATQYGAVTNNTVTLAGGTVKLVVGGQSDNNGDVTDNTVTISGGTVQYSDVGVYGGRSVKGTVKNNHVNISAGTVDGSYPSTSSGIFGGCSYNGAATNNNTVTITGGKITGKVVGGASNTATDNNIILAKGAAAANLQSATLYGSIRDASYHGDVSLPDTHSGNTLTVEGEKNITVANVKNFDIYNFVLPADVQN